VPISAVAYGFLTLVHFLQEWVFDDLPHGLGFSEVPAWWPLPVLGLAGVLVGLVIRYLPGGGGHSPAHGFQAGGLPDPRHLPGVVVAAVVGLGLGVVLGPEAPLIAMGGGLARAGARSRTSHPAHAGRGDRRRGRQLRRRRHPAGLTHRRRVLPHGGHRDRWAGHGPGARSPVCSRPGSER
jgi:H+/Cl- antiporter ClcA